MNRDEFRLYTEDRTVSDLAGLVLACGGRFARAAKLIGYRTVEVDHLSELSLWSAASVSPLMSLWPILCDRYLSELFSPQMQLWPDIRLEPSNLWHLFVHGMAIPDLTRLDSFVRAVLVIVGLLKNPSLEGAVALVERRLAEYPLRDFRTSQFSLACRQPWAYANTGSAKWPTPWMPGSAPLGAPTQRSSSVPTSLRSRLDELAFYQNRHSTANLLSLVSECAKRFYRSMELVGIESREISSVWSSDWTRENLSALKMPWHRLCGRFRNAVATHVTSSALGIDSDLAAMWHQFLNSELLPTLVWDDEFVRTILSAVRKLHCDSIVRAVGSVESYFMSFPFTGVASSWLLDAQPSEMIDDDDGEQFN